MSWCVCECMSMRLLEGEPAEGDGPRVSRQKQLPQCSQENTSKRQRNERRERTSKVQSPFIFLFFLFFLFLFFLYNTNKILSVKKSAV